MTYIAKGPTFTKTGRFVDRGQLIQEGEIDYEDGKSDAHLIDAPAGVEDLGVVQASAIAPTGPNPTAPQQIAPDTIQTPGGYEQAGARVVAEVTAPVEKRITIVGIDEEDDTQAKVTEALEA